MAAVVAAMVLAPVQSAWAADLGGFEIDGDLTPVAGGATDWSGLGGAACVLDGISDSTGYKGAESSDVESWAGDAVASGKTDIAAIQTHSLVDSATDHQWTYVAVQRATTEGSTYFTFEYNQKPNHQSRPTGNGTPASVPTRTTGDLRLMFQQQGNAQNEVLGKIVIDGMDRWVGGQWVAQTIAPSAIAGLSNTVAVNGLCGSAQAVPGAFMEVALDLTVLGMEPGCESGGFGTFNVRSRQSPSISSEMSDVAIGSADILPNCGRATITKRGPSGEVVGGPALRFQLSPDPRDGTGTAYVSDNVTTGLSGNEVPDADDRPGYVAFTTSRFGVYTLTEVAPPAGYLLPGDTTATVTVARYSDVPVEVVDPLGTGTVLKVDADTGKPLAGAEFSFTKTAAPYQGTAITVRDNGAGDLDPRDGYVRAGGLYTGAWDVEETDAPAGYLRGSATQTLTISQDTPDPVLAKAFENKQNGTLVWDKVGEDGSTRLAGAHFRLDRLVGGQAVESVDITDNTGRDADDTTGGFRVSGLRFGTWRVTETQAPEGYLAADPQTVELSAQAHTLTFAFVNTENGQVTWRKVDEFGEVLHGAAFTLSQPGQSVAVTDNTGQSGYQGRDTNPAPGYFAVTGLDFGDWTLTETTVPQGYAAGAAKHLTVTASASTVDVGDVVNTQDGRVSWTKVGEDGNPLAGAEFTVATGSGKGSQSIHVTDNTGQSGYDGPDTDARTGRFALEGLDFGTWTLTETVAPLGYTGLTKPMEFTVSAQDQTVGLGAIRNAMNGRLAWSKVGEDGAPLAGATFTLTLGDQVVSVPDNTGQPGYEGADTNPGVGLFAVAGLDFGTWTLAETVVPTGYAGIEPRAVEVVPSATPILLGAIENTENGRASWSKVGEHDELLGGAVFTLTPSESGVQGVQVADNTGQGGYQGRDTNPVAGQFSVDGLDFGSWTLSETQPPAGYAGGAPVQLTVTAEASSVALSAIHNTEDGRITWRKTDENDQPLSGAGFTLTQSAPGTTTPGTAVAPTAQVVDVPDNTGQPGYEGSDTDQRAGYFAVAGLDFGTWTLSETTVPAGYAQAADRTVTITAQDSRHELTIVNSANGIVTWTKVGEGGEPLTGASFELSQGDQVLAVEDNTGQPGYDGFDRDPAPAAYRVVGLDFGPWTLTETQAPTGYTAGAPRTIEVGPQTPVATFGAVHNTEDGRLAWTKVGEDGTPLAGAGFTLTTPGQSVVVDDFTGQAGYQGRDRDPDAGEFLVDGLDFATWTLTETTVPSGYAAGSPVVVDVPRSAAVLHLSDIENTEDGRATWTKVGEDGTPLAGAGFTLTMGGQSIVVDDFTGQAGYAGRDTDPTAGEFAVSGLDFGTWTLSETTVPAGYSGAADRSFTVDGGQSTAELGQVVNTENGRVVWTKVDEKGARLGGAVFELRLPGKDGDQRVEVADNTGQDGYTGRDTDATAGEFAVAGLDFGTWTLVETQAPEGYLRDTDSRPVVMDASTGAVDAGVFVNVAVWATVSGHKSVWELDASGQPVESDGVVDYGDTVLYGIDVTAGGSVPQTGVTVTDPLPKGISFVSGSADCQPQPCTIDYDAKTATLTWSVEEMQPGAVVTVYFLATVDAAPALPPGGTAHLRVDNVGSVGSDLAPTTPTNAVRVEASATAPPVEKPPVEKPPVVPPVEKPPSEEPQTPQGPTPVPPTAPHTPHAPQTPALTPSPRTPLAHTGVDGLPQLLGGAALLLVVGAGLWRVASRREV
ncbi:SpaA isopeptide-forming pilin-related protein [Phycicoccus sp. SLBN-51]|uniref:SpaA isopeptide-forming pilin-related protein n=1 Tax=Phycicoccus sp. SLBN-51 TaxID=2768447 RepID=UPI00114DCFD0|nr:SpaA isopeptide-forming pilin-related protein [Phycicoccus sp. SLBN-51]TQJ48638.1 putative repeat protein (TIGR01451 family) [Phycicoccus sp. SLBN-51]